MSSKSLFQSCLFVLMFSHPAWPQSSTPSCFFSWIHESESVPNDPAQQLKIQQLRFEGVNKLPVAEMEGIASELKKRVYDKDDHWLDDLMERAQDEWQAHGHFQVKVQAQFRELTNDSPSKNVAVIMHVDEGEQYRLKDIRFVNGKKFQPSRMRSLFPMEGNDVFDTRLIQQGLGELRKLYNSQGFLNFTAAPATEINEQERLISMVVDLDEGPQFHIAEITIRGDDQDLARKALHDAKIKTGEIFSTTRWDEFVNKVRSVLPGYQDNSERKLDEKDGTVSLIIDMTIVPPCDKQ